MMPRNRLPRIASGLARASAWICFLALALAAVALLAGRYLAATVGDYQGQIEAFLRDRGFDYVSIGEISGAMQVFDPAFDVRQAHFDVGGEAVLEIDRLVVRLDTLRTLVSRSPIVAEVRVSGVRLGLDRIDGKFSIRGLPAGDEPLSLDYLLDSLPHLKAVILDNVDIDIRNEGIALRLRSAEDQPWSIIAASDAAANSKAVSLSAVLTRELADGQVDQGELHLAGSYAGDIREEDFRADLFLDIPRMDLGSVFPNPGQRIRLVRADMNGKLWVSVMPGDVDITSAVELANVRLERSGDSDGETSLLFGASASGRFRGDSITQGGMVIPNLALRAGDAGIELADVKLAVAEGDGGFNWAASLAGIDAASALAMLPELAKAGLVTESLQAALNAVNPQGRLADICALGNSGTEQFKVVSRLDGVSIEAHLGVPAISGASGLLSMGPGSGYIDLDSNAFTMHFAKMFDESWSLTSARGRVAYESRPDRLVVRSGLIELTDGELSAHGKVVLSLPAEQELRTWALTLGVRDANLLDAHKYLPDVLDADLKAWLRNGVKGGRALESGLLFHGALFRDAPGVRKTHGAYFKVEDGALNYHDDWPVAQRLKATVHVANHEVTARGATGRVFDTAVSGINVTVPVPPGGADAVLVDASVQGGMTDAIRTLNETPLARTTNDMAAHWSGEGEMLGSLNLNIPIGARSDEEVDADVRMRFTGASLDMRDYDLTAVELEGDASYTTQGGVVSEGFTGKMFGQPISGRIESELIGPGGEIAVSVSGAIDVRDLHAWSGQLLLTRAEGMARYSVKVHVPYGGVKDQPWLEASSDLVGVTMNLPAPLAKPDAGSAVKLAYRQIFLEEGYRVDLSAGAGIKSSLKVEDEVVSGGRIHFGDTPLGAVTYDAVRMSGKVPYVDYEAWENALDEIATVADVPIEREINDHVHSLDLHIDRLKLFDLTLEDAQAHVVRQTGGWLANIEDKTLKGEITVPDDDGPIGINLEYLRLETEGEEGEDPLGETDPLGYDDIDFAVRLLTLDGEDYGTWSFKYRAGEGQATLGEVTAETRGVSVQPNSQVTWQVVDGQHQSRFAGSLLVPDLGDALERFGFASSIEGENMELDADVVWAGSPVMMDVDHITGSINLREGKGKFVQAETGGPLKLLGIFDFAQIGRRFQLDFSDVVSSGYEFNSISGATRLDAGEIDVTDPIVILSSAGKFTVGGRIDLNTRELDNEMIVTLPVGRTLPWYAAYSAIATGPLAGAGVMIAQKVFENQIDAMSSAKYRISGTIEEPVIEFVSIFDDSVSEGGQEPADEAESAAPETGPEAPGESGGDGTPGQ